MRKFFCWLLGHEMREESSNARRVKLVCKHCEHVEWVLRGWIPRA